MREGYQWCEECEIYYNEDLYSSCPLCYQKSLARKVEFVQRWDKRGDSPIGCIIVFISALILLALLSNIYP